MSSTDAPKWVTLAPDESIVWGGRPSPYLVKYWIEVAALVLLAGIVALVWILPSNWSWLGWLGVPGGRCDVTTSLAPRKLEPPHARSRRPRVCQTGGGRERQR